MSESRTVRSLYDADADATALDAAFRSGEVPVAVYGLGKMGLPLAAVYADVTGNVAGVDIDPEVVSAIQAGDCPVEGEPGLPDLVADLVDDGALRAVESGREAAPSTVHVLIVPTLVDDGEPDLSALLAAVDDVAATLSAGDLVIVESTVPPRTCEDVVLPRLLEGSDLDRGEFGLAFCPERTLSGRALEDIRGGHPKVIGGVDEASAAAAEVVYDAVHGGEILTASDATTAEAVKVFEGVYRDTNIALANELAKHAPELGVDVTEAIDIANSQPFCEIHDPGAGVGGHCIPLYPYFLTEPFDAPSPLMETARAVNDSMPSYTADAVERNLRDEGVDPADARVLVLGATYRPGVDEIRKTPALPLVEELADAGADVDVVDPVCTSPGPFEDRGATVRTLEDVEADAGYDAAVMVTPQPAFDDLEVATLGGEGRLVVVDGRQALTELRGDDRVRYTGVGIDA
ncbi:nucleotide sugar dehydrogenase [Natronomonas salina]|uniref:nucleotide sugar dehydrogenase n=1 Tax=Natronomonas salina TaxID=1710540 RepID=UPI0015B5EF86|nr:nucleotide sugar dehydrogenase [Natronomonas salina]QLD89425.1 nucleotide sugar dehydrogenase [Natronomonas salina]